MGRSSTILCATLFCGAIGCLRLADPTPDPPSTELQHLARVTIHSYSTGLADSFIATADQITAGSLTTAAETNSHLKISNAEARQAAFLPIDERLNAELGGERWNAEHAAKVFRELAAGFRRLDVEHRETLAPSP